MKSAVVGPKRTNDETSNKDANVDEMDEKKALRKKLKIESNDSEEKLEGGELDEHKKTGDTKKKPSE